MSLTIKSVDFVDGNKNRTIDGEDNVRVTASQDGKKEEVKNFKMGEFLSLGTPENRLAVLNQMANESPDGNPYNVSGLLILKNLAPPQEGSKSPSIELKQDGVLQRNSQVVLEDGTSTTVEGYLKSNPGSLYSIIHAATKGGTSECNISADLLKTMSPEARKPRPAPPDASKIS